MLLRVAMVLFLEPWHMCFRKVIELSTRSSPHENVPTRLLVNSLSDIVNMNLELGFVEVLWQFAFFHLNARPNIFFE